MTTTAKIRALLTKSERREAGVLLGLMIIGMLMEMIGLGLVVPAVALLVEGDPVARYPQLKGPIEALGNPTQAQLVAGGMIALVVIYLIKTAFLVFLAWRQTRVAFKIQAGLSARLFTTYLRQPYVFHLQRNSAQLVHNTIQGVSQFVGSVITQGMLLVAEGLVLVGVFAVLLIVEPVGASIVVAALSVTALASQRAIGSRLTRWGAARHYHEGMRVQHLQQGLGAAKDVKLLGRESEFLAQYQNHNSESARVVQLEAMLRQLPRLWLELLGIVALASLVFALLAQGRNIASIVPTLGLFAVAAFRLMPSVNRMLGAAQALRFGLPAVDDLYCELQLPSEDPALASGAQVPPFCDQISFQSVSFTYPTGASPAIDAMSFQIRQGEAVGIVGPSGSGKSTLVDVLLGLLTPTSGSVAVDGRDIQQDLRGWQNQIGYVPQTIFLTDDSLRRNIAFGLSEDDIDDAAVQRAVTAAQLDTYVSELHEGLGSKVGERGVQLSGGQRQRIGIARALYHDPAVLVLDEATSALDPEIEQDVMQAVMALHQSKTVVIVAHRHSTVEHCDRLYRVTQGKLKEIARPAEREFT